MKVICVASSGRIDKVQLFLESLSANNTEGWMLYVCFEPGTSQAQDIVRSANFIQREVWMNFNQLGPEANTFKVCKGVMEEGAEDILYTDDDMILSPDALDLCNWFLEHHASHYPGGLCLCTDDSNPDRPHSISPNDTWRGLVGQGYCYTRQIWEDFVKPNFWADDPKWGGHGYDWAIGYRSVELGKTILRPRFSRSQHIGIHGHHGGRIFPEHYCKTKVGNFVIENE